MFCVLSQNYQHFFGEENACILNYNARGTQNGIVILVGQVVLSYGSKQPK